MEPSALSGEFKFQSGVFAQLLPVFLRHFLSQFQGSLGSGVDSVVNDHDMTTAQLVQTSPVLPAARKPAIHRH